eukprot:tig00020592_g11683.t1
MPQKEDPRWRAAYEELIKKEERAKAKRFQEEAKGLAQPEIPRWSGGCLEAMHLQPPVPKERLPELYEIELREDRNMNSAARQKRERERGAADQLQRVKSLVAAADAERAERRREATLQRAVWDAQRIAERLRAEIDYEEAALLEEARAVAAAVAAPGPPSRSEPRAALAPLPLLRRARSGDLPPRFDGTWTFDSKGGSRSPAVPHGHLLKHQGAFDRSLRPPRPLRKEASIGALRPLRSEGHDPSPLLGGTLAFHKVRREDAAVGRPMDPLILRYALPETWSASHNAYAMAAAAAARR